jgi:hypothetical protein
MTSTDDHRIEPGQEYERHDPRENTTLRIRVAGPQVPGPFGEGEVAIVTVEGDRYLRRRWIAIRQLHNSPTRRTGYRLVQHADGSDA